MVSGTSVGSVFFKMINLPYPQICKKIFLAIYFLTIKNMCAHLNSATIGKWSDFMSFEFKTMNLSLSCEQIGD